MKQLIIFLLLFFSLSAGASDYYFSTSGSDANAGTQASPYQSLTKLNTMLASAASGDRFFLKRGDSWYGSVTGKSGVTLGAYGTGQKPVIYGWTTLSKVNTNWTTVAANTYEITVPNGLAANLNMVTLDGNVQAQGRYPNMTQQYGSYIRYQSHQGDSVVMSSDTALYNQSTNWLGAQFVVRSSDWTIDTAQILSYTKSGGNTTIRVASSKIYSTAADGSPIMLSKSGFFIQNDPKTLDSQGEWYYNMSTKKFRIYLTSTPSAYTIKVATQTYGILIDGDDYVTIENLRFEGFNSDAIRANNTSTNKIIQWCEFQWCRSAIWIEDGGSDYTDIFNNTISDMSCQGIFHQFADNLTCRGNTLDRIAIWPGMGALGFTGHGILGTRSTTGNCVIAQNIVRNVGYIGIRADNNNLRIDSNYVDHAMLTHMDGGGIYLGNFNTEYTNRKVRHNVVLNTIGNSYGTSQDSLTNPVRNGAQIYLDDYCHDVEVAYNTVGYTTQYTAATTIKETLGAIYLHNSRNMNIHDNLFFGGYKYVVFFSTDANMTASINKVWGTRFYNNTTISRLRDEFVLRVRHEMSDSNYIKLFDEANGAAVGTNVNDYINDNIIARPVNQDSITHALSWAGSGAKYRTVSMWKANFGLDSRSTGTPKQFQSNSNIDTVFKFYYNTEAGDTTFTLPRTLMDMRGDVHLSGESVTLPGYSGIVYLAHTAAVPVVPTAPYKLYINKQGKLYINRQGKFLIRGL